MRSQEPEIERATLTDQIVDRLKKRILDGRLVSGERMWAADLAEEFGTSIIPVKEALLILQAENFITNIPRRGSVVRQFTRTEMEELYDLREMIEVEALRRAQAVGAINQALIDELTACNRLIGRLRKNDGFSDQAAAFELDRRFHDVLVGASGHGALAQWYTSLNQQVQIIRYASWNIGPRGDKTYNEHVDIIDALKQGSVGAAKKAVSNHLHSIRSDFSRSLDNTAVDGSEFVGGERLKPHGRRTLKQKAS